MNPTKRAAIDMAVKLLVDKLCIPNEQIERSFDYEEDNKIGYIFGNDLVEQIVVVEYEYVGSCMKIKSITFK